MRKPLWLHKFLGTADGPRTIQPRRCGYMPCGEFLDPNPRNNPYGSFCSKNCADTDRAIW